MARKVDQIVRRGARTWLVRMYNGRESRIEKAKVLEPNRSPWAPASAIASEQNAHWGAR